MQVWAGLDQSYCSSPCCSAEHSVVLVAVDTATAATPVDTTVTISTRVDTDTGNTVTVEREGGKGFNDVSLTIYVK
jgi:hypothetical protein